jgi:Rrf2 family protein
MKINTKIRYGLRTMIVIANAPNLDGILQKDIAENQDISLKYLDSIISSLKLKGLIVNVRGKGSGYKLARSADEITVFDIYTAFERIDIVDCIDNPEICIKTSQNCNANAFWCEFKSSFSSILKNKKLSDIII